MQYIRILHQVCLLIEENFDRFLPFPDFRNKVDVIAENSFVWISSAASERYFVLNALGQVLARGKVLGSVKVEIPTAGNYWVRVGSETHFVRIRGK